VISVLLRDYYYIAFYGLAYKRIGVLFFLLAVLAGLLTVAIKIYYNKTTYYLFRVNAWVCICMLVISSTIDWDKNIAAYNLNNKTQVPVDLNFLFRLSDRTIPLIEQNMDVLKQTQMNYDAARNEPGYLCDSCFIQRLKQREKDFLARQQQYSWLSWNLADASLGKYLKQEGTESISEK
jgi:hypothetical protein